MTKHIVGFSGGIDSQAVCGLVLDEHDPEQVIIMNSDAGGNEHPLTTAHVEWYSRTVHPVIRANAVIADMWITPEAAEARGYDGAAALDFGAMIKIKKRPPSRKAQFCTEILKLRPQRRWIDTAFGIGGQYEGDDYIRYTGVRRDESYARSQRQSVEWDDYFDCELRRPIFDWPKQRCFDFVQARGELVNPLYSMGFNRVGCAPCINSSKADILNWSMRAPEMIEKVRRWEKESGRTFFPPMVPGLSMNDIDEVLAWVKTSRGGRQVMLFQPSAPACSSKYGLCD